MKMRFALSLLAIVLFLQSAWVLTPELFRRRLPYFPTTKAQLAEFSDARENADTAARLAWLRGDLWTEFALTAGAPFLEGGAAAREMIAEDRVIAEQAARLAPSDARAWLLLSDINYNSGTDTDTAASQLKMSFYTAPNDRRLLPLRLLLASRSAHLDDEIQNLIEHDLHVIAGHQSDLKPALLDAYKIASPTSREFIEKKLADIDPQLLADLRQSR